MKAKTTCSRTCENCKFYRDIFNDGWTYQEDKYCTLNGKLIDDCPDFKERCFADDIEDLAWNFIGLVVIAAIGFVMAHI